jgi:hypothetical protein
MVDVVVATPELDEHAPFLPPEEVDWHSSRGDADRAAVDREIMQPALWQSW